MNRAVMRVLGRHRARPVVALLASVTLLAVMVVGGLIASPPAAASTNSASLGSLTVTPNTTYPGSSFTISGTGCSSIGSAPASVTVAISDSPSHRYSFVPASSGVWVLTARMPARISLDHGAVALATVRVSTVAEYWATVTIPVNTSLGAHTITVEGYDGLTASKSITVVAASPTQPPSLPNTGAPVAKTLSIGLVLTGLGAAGMFLGRRRGQLFSAAARTFVSAR